MKKKTVTAMTALVLGLSITAPAVYAEANLSEVKEKQQQVETEKQKAKEQVNELTTEIDKLVEELRVMDAKVEETELKVIEKRETVEKTKQQIEKLKQEIIELEERIERRTEILKNRAVSFQQEGSGMPYLNVLLGADSFADLLTRMSSVATVMEADNEIVRSNEKDLAQVEANKKEVDEKLVINEKDLQDLKNAEAELKKQAEQKKAIRIKIEEEKAKAEGEVERLEGEERLLAGQETAILKAQEEAARKLEEEYKRQQEASKQQTASSGNAGNTNNASTGGGQVVGPTPPVSSGFFTRPASGRVSAEIGDGRGHKGVDIASGGTVPIVAAGDGIVTRSNYSSSYGEVIYITHNVNGQTMTSVYAHMRSGSRTVSAGQVVKKGQQIGLMGNTGDSDGQHLHFELHNGPWTQNKQYFVDPRKYINF
jgi:peptidoglycan hydrolase CwlO-like protein